MNPGEPAGLVLRAPAHLVSPRAVLFWTVRAGLGWLGLLAIEAALLAANRATGSVWVSALVPTLVLAGTHLLVMPRWRYRVHRWEITPVACYSQAGWLNQERRIAPLSRIQTVDTERGPLEQLFSLANVTVTTASAAGPIKIHGLDRATAEQIVARLTTATAAHSGDAT